MQLKREIDEALARLAWSLWTELGVAGVKRNHKDVLIAPEELIILTAAIAEFDPRLRDEALDWMSRYQRFISTTRLKSLAKKYPFLKERLSEFISAVSDSLSGKSVLCDFANPSMLYFRLRALFGVNARADIVIFFLQRKGSFSAAEIAEIGYTKRHLAEILQDLEQAGLLKLTMAGNQMRYSWREPEFIGMLGQLPERMITWYRFLDVILPLRDSINRFEKKSIESRVVEIRLLLKRVEPQLEFFGMDPPALRENLEVYWEELAEWILDFIRQF